MDLVQLIESAIEDEREAQTKYAQAAQEAEDTESRAFFEQLVREEQGHEERLKRRLMAIKLIHGD
ncbi:MAG: ferritin family protein [Candidatus Aquicultorales bacterium]